MPSFLHPAALWALVALALPVAIHLWRPPPRTVLLGSLRFLERTARRPLRHLRWRELILLGVRLSLLAAMVWLLAGPARKFSPFQKPQHWALLDPTAKLTGDALAKWKETGGRGCEARLLAPGFPKISSPDGPVDAVATDLWSLLREADAELPAGSSLTVFSPGRLAGLRGVRPTLGRCSLEWVVADDVAGIETHEWVGGRDGTRVIEARSDAHATILAAKSVAGPALPLNILILHDIGHANESAALEAAIRAAGESAGRPVALLNREITPDAENAAATDWLFWLSQQPVPEGLAQRAARVVRYAAGASVNLPSAIVSLDGTAADGVAIWRRLSEPTPAAAVLLWSDATGDPVLTYSETTGHVRWILHTRLDPGWTDLPRTTALAEWMRALLFAGSTNPSNVDPRHDLRRSDPAQGKPQRGEESATALFNLAPAEGADERFDWPLCALAALLFGIERTLSLRRSTAGRIAVIPARHSPSQTVSSR